MIICPTDTFADALVGDGIVEYCPNATSIAKYFTELIVNGNLIIPPQKPPKEHIVKVTHLIKITDVEVITITLPDGTIAGKKILVSGVITLGVQYVADVPDQKVHFVHYDIPFNTVILSDCGAPIDTTDPIFPDNFVVHVCVEKIRLTQINNRTLNKEIVLMVWIEEK